LLKLALRDFHIVSAGLADHAIGGAILGGFGIGIGPCLLLVGHGGHRRQGARRCFLGTGRTWGAARHDDLRSTVMFSARAKSISAPKVPRSTCLFMRRRRRSEIFRRADENKNGGDPKITAVVFLADERDSS